MAAIFAKRPDEYSWDYINLSDRHRFVCTVLTKKQLKVYMLFVLKMGAADCTTRYFRRRRSTSKYMTRCACSSRLHATVGNVPLTPTPPHTHTHHGRPTMEYRDALALVLCRLRTDMS